MEPGWEEHFGYLRDMGYAIVVGEWGGNRFWPTGGGARQSEADAWGHVDGAGESNNIDFQWQKIFAGYMNDHDIESCYWGINPESSDTGGIYNHGSNWGVWEGIDNVKLNMLKNHWGI